MPVILTAPTNPGVATWSDGTMVGASAAYQGRPSQQNFVFGGNPSDGETYELELLGVSVTSTFRAAPSAATDVQIGGSAAATQTNLVAAIDANQGTVVNVQERGGVAYLTLNEIQPTDEGFGNVFIAQTDGTGGDITIRKPFGGGTAGGLINIAPRALNPVYFLHTVLASEVTDGQIVIQVLGPSNTEWAWWEYSVLCMDASSKGVGVFPTIVKDFTGTYSTLAPPGSGEVLLQINNAGATPYAAGDIFVVWGFLYEP